MNKSQQETHRKQCLRRHYENMDKLRANKVLSNLNTVKERQVFIKRINHAKNYTFIDPKYARKAN